MGLMADIIGRNIEQDILNSLYNSKKSEFIAIYGRRRIGKTFLIREMFKDRFAFYHTGLSPFELKGKKLLTEQLHNFALSLARYGFRNTTVPTGWMEAFNLLIELLESKGKESRQVVFLDEVPWMDTHRSGFITALEHFWNGWGAGRDNLMLIVCGSATSWINDNLINNTGGLYGRLTKHICLSPMTLAETEELFESHNIRMDRYDIVQSWMIFGGIPYYLSSLTKERSLAQNVDDLLFRRGSGLADEFDRLFNSLFVNPEDYKRIVRFLSTSNSGYTREEIAAKASSSGGGLTKILRVLKENGFISAFQDFSGRSKDLRYRLTDPFCMFYLKFIDGHRTNDEAFWENSQFLPGINAWRGLAFENVCFAHIRQIKAALGISGVRTEVFSWIFRGNDEHDGAQIDMLIDRADRIINLCEIKFSIAEYTITKDYDRKLRQRLQTFFEVVHPKKTIHQTFITTYGLRSNEYSGKVQSVITMDDLFR